jgi:DNA-binding GntR family transcriptional regulator
MPTAAASSARDKAHGRSRARGTTVADLVAHLRDNVLLGRYAPGQRLIEADLTRELGVSRGPLREAFRRLTAEGLIESIPNRGAVVRQLSQRQIRELFEIRSALETMAARLAAKNMANREIRAKFEAAVAPVWSERGRGLPSAYLDENRAFHEAVADASGNEQLAVFGRTLQLPLVMHQATGSLTPEILTTSNAEHRAIAEAILAGDGERAAEAMRAHLQHAADFSDSLPPHFFRS